MSDEVRTGAVLFATALDRVVSFYAVVLGLEETARAGDHVVLESPGFQLVVHRAIGGSVPGGEAATPVRRTSAAFKPVFFVSSISSLRGVVETHGGDMEPTDREWSFHGCAVCDACDPEGNVIQLRERRR